MDPDDAIQQLLKNTGWSCDDLLAKLQKLKASDNNKNTNNNPSSTKSNTEENKVDNRAGTELINPNSHVEEKETTKSVSDKDEDDIFSDTDEKEININRLKPTNADNPPLVKNIHKTLNDTSEVTDVRDLEINNENEEDKKEHETFNVQKKQCKTITIKTDLPKVSESKKTLVKSIHKPLNDTSEVTEVRVIEVNNENEEDEKEHETFSVQKKQCETDLPKVSESKKTLVKSIHKPLNDTSEVTEVRVIEVNNENEEDEKEHETFNVQKKQCETITIKTDLPKVSEIKKTLVKSIHKPLNDTSEVTEVRVIEVNNENEEDEKEHETFNVQKKQRETISIKTDLPKVSESKKTLVKSIRKTLNDTSEVTKVRVIEVNNGNEKDEKEHETFNVQNKQCETNTIKTDLPRVSESKKTVKYIQILPRKSYIPILPKIEKQPQPSLLKLKQPEIPSLQTCDKFNKPEIPIANQDLVSNNVNNISSINLNFKPQKLLTSSKLVKLSSQQLALSQKLSQLLREPTTNKKKPNTVHYHIPTISNSTYNGQFIKFTFPKEKPVETITKEPINYQIEPNLSEDSSKSCSIIKDPLNFSGAFITVNSSKEETIFKEPINYQIEKTSSITLEEPNKPFNIQKVSTDPPNFADKLRGRFVKINIPKSIVPIETKTVTPEDSDEEMPLPPTDGPTVEELRNNIKLQLNSLRNRKKTTLLPTVQTKVTDNVECSQKLSKVLLNKTNVIENITTTNINQAQEDNPSSFLDNKPNFIDDHLYTQTNELGLVILDVQGGVELEDIEEGTNKNQQETVEIPSDSCTSKETENNPSSCQESPRDTNNKPSTSKNTIVLVEERKTNEVPNTELCITGTSKATITNQKLPKTQLTIEENNNSVSDTIKSPSSVRTEEVDENGVFDQIRKIINKPKIRLKEFNNLIGTTSPSVIDKPNEIKKLDISCENSQSSFIESTDVEEKSPFVSDSLDEFLTASQLNISYQLPKLRAEEGLKTHTEEPPLMLKRVERFKTPSGKLKGNSVIKAKTVAQKRRILERERRKELKRLERKKQKEQQRQHEQQKQQEQLDIIKNEDIKEKSQIIEEESNNDTKIFINDPRSYILYKNSKIYVNSNDKHKCLDKIECKPEIDTTKRKWSLLNEQYKKQTAFNKIRYRPGPLSKKENLQVTFSNTWESKILKLPQIFIELTPKIGKPFSDDILHRIPSVIGGELNSVNIEFALSMVQSKNSKIDDVSFEFPLKYHNNIESVIVKRKKPLLPTKVEESVKIKKSTNVINDIIQDLITYVEIKELAPTLIKDDDNLSETEDLLDKKLLSPRNESNLSIFKKPSKRKSKIDLELLRLSCKVVNVEIEDNQELNCKKSYCKLGCICRSLKCEYNISRHCQKVECIFNCSCPKEKPQQIFDKFTLPAGTDILSTDAVNKIEDEAKRNLAKIEREFTQTVIHTNDKTIVVGIGNRNKTRRMAKAPAKFTDYIDLAKISDCSVKLSKINVTGIKPYCLQHHLHDCYCKGLSTYIPPKYYDETKKKTLINKIADIDADEYRPYKHYIKKRKQQKLKPQQKTVTITDTDSSSDIGSSTKRPSRNLKKRIFSDEFIIDEESESFLSRATPISRQYLQSYKFKYTDQIFINDFINNVTDADLLKIREQINNSEIIPTEADFLKQALIQEKMAEPYHYNSVSNKNKRKQTLETRNDDSDVPKLFNKVAALQRRKKRNLTEIKRVFDGEIIIDKSNMDLLMKMGPKTLSDGYARLLPWLALIKSFKNGSINIWCMIDQPSRLLLNRSYKKCPKNYIDIKETSQMTEVITWILQNKLPSHYEEDSLSFILKEGKDNFEICGICTKNITNENLLSNQKQYNNIDERPEIFYHKDLHGVERMFTLYKEKTLKSYTVVQEHLTPLPSNVLSVTLPDIVYSCKWRMILLNSEFTYLFFKRVNYSIRYTDLNVVVEYAKKHNCTVSLKNKDLKGGYDNTIFGIYFDPRYYDRIFIGPYFKHQKNDVETLRYINQSLVSTESFNKMRGNSDYQSGYWVTQTKIQLRPPAVNEATIDLTMENEDYTFSTKNTISEMAKSPLGINKKLYPAVVLHNGFDIKIIDAQPRKPEEFNRYIITNIPHFGYLGAFSHPKGELDVSWPFENKMLRFLNVKSAMTFLQERFSQLLQPVPETFKITTIVAVTIDLNLYRPIDCCVLSGHYICGDFGYYDIMTLTDEDCRSKLNHSKEDILKMFAKRAQLFVRKKIEHLADIIDVKKNSLQGYDLAKVLDKAKKEIGYLTKKCERNDIIRRKLLLQKRQKALVVHALLSQLPRDIRNRENLKFRAILYNSNPVEIYDSDEETSKNKTIEEKPNSSPMKTSNQISLLKPIVPKPVFSILKPENSELSPITSTTNKVKTVKPVSRMVSKKTALHRKKAIKKKFVIKNKYLNRRDKDNSNIIDLDKDSESDDLITTKTVNKYTIGTSNKIDKSDMMIIDLDFEETDPLAINKDDINISNSETSKIINLDNAETDPLQIQPEYVELDTVFADKNKKLISNQTKSNLLKDVVYIS